MFTSILLAALGVVTSATSQPSKTASPNNFLGLGNELAPPVRIEAAGKPIDTVTGHAAPFVGDFDGDGVPDLLVGQFGEGKLRVYPNVGSKTEPRFDKFEWFQAGGKLGTVPAS